MAALTLWLGGCENYSLLRSRFELTTSSAVYQSVRGKTSGAYNGFGTFQWTSAVKAVTCLCIRHYLSAYNKTIDSLLVGRRDSLASSLDYSICKETNWISEMFGYGANGNCNAKRLFLRTNSNQKHHGPVSIGINSKMLSANDIRFVVNDAVLNDTVTNATKLHDILMLIEASRLKQGIDLSVFNTGGREVDNVVACSEL